LFCSFWEATAGLRSIAKIAVSSGSYVGGEWKFGGVEEVKERDSCMNWK
jgi:hypothetical protein